MLLILTRILSFLTILVLFGLASARDEKKWCAACRLIVDEIEYEISNTDPHKVLEVEGFRVDPSGNLKNKKIPYARSETHLTEITESLCSRMNEFLESTGHDGRITYVPSKSRDGKPLKLENVSMSGETAEKLRHMCNTIIEEHEDSIIDFFRKSVEHPRMEFCSLLTDYCEHNIDLYDDHKDEL